MAAPQFDANNLTITEGQILTLSINELDASVSDPNVLDSEIIFEILPASDPDTGGSLLAGTFLLTTAMGTVETTTFSLQDISNGNVQFRHDSTNRIPQYTVTATNADTSEESAVSTPTVNLIPINDAPRITTNILIIEEGQTVVLNSNIDARNLVAQDEESVPTELTYEITELSNGQFQRISSDPPVNLGVGDTFTQAEVNAGAIAFRHDGSETAPAYEVRVVDSGTPENPTSQGAPKGARSEAIINFTQINDAPELLLNQLSLQEGETVVLTTTENLDATDIDNTDSSLEFIVTSITGGRFELFDRTTGETITVLASPSTDPIAFTKNDVMLQQVRFVNDPATDTPPTYTIQVRDADGAFDSSPAVIAFQPVNDIPRLVNLSLTVEEGEPPVVLTSDNLLVEDEESDPENLRYEVLAEDLQGGRFIFLATGETATQFTQADIDAGNIIAFEQDGTNTAPAFSLQVTDEGGESIIVNSGDDVQFRVINDLPEVQVAQLTVTEGGQINPLTSAGNLRAIDEETTSPSQLRYTATIQNADPTKPDRFVVNGIESNTFTQAEINAGQVVFIHGGSNEAPDITLTLTDTAVGPEAPANTITVDDLVVNFTATNDTPIFSTNNLTIDEGGTVVLNSGTLPNLETTDEESSAAELTYTIVSVSNGVFQRLGATTTDILVGGTFTQAEVDAGDIQFVHDGGEQAPDYDLSVTDTGLEGDPDAAIPTTRDLVVTFNSENDAPQLETNVLTLTEGDSFFIDSSNLSATDEEDNDANLLFTVTAITNGLFERVTTENGTEVVTELASPTLQTPVAFTQDDVQQGRIRFTHVPATDDAPTYTVEVSDLSNPALTDEEAAIIDFTEVNDRPLLDTLAFTVVEEGGLVDLTTARLNVIDEEADPADITYTVNNVTGGRFVRRGEGGAISEALTFTQAEIDAGNVIAFEPNNLNEAPTFNLTVSDDEPTNAITITHQDGDGVTFEAFNDVPDITTTPLILEEGQTVDVNNLSAVDEETPADQLVYTVTIVNEDETQPDGFEIAGELQLGPTVTFTQAQVDDGLVRFVHGGSNFAPDLTVTLTDNPTQGTSNVEDVLFDINFTATNDAPILERNTLTISEGETVTLTAADNLSTLDEETLPENLTYTIAAVAEGSFQLLDTMMGTSSPLDVGATFTQADVNAGRIQFVHSGGEAPPSYRFTVTDTALVQDGLVNSFETTVDIPEGGFTPINDDPTFSVNQLEISEGGTVTFSAANLAVTDPDTSQGLLQLEISNIVGGTFFLDGVPLIPDSTFGVSEIPLLSFQDDGNEEAPSYTVTVRDPLGGVTQEAADIFYTAVNDPPRQVTNTFTITEGEPLILNDPAEGTVNLAFEDDESMSDAELTYTFNNVVGGQFFDLNNNPLTDQDGASVGSVTQQQINNGEVVFEHDGSETMPTFDITVTDSDPDNPRQTTVAANVAFVPVNDPPVLENNQITVTEGTPFIVSTDNFSVIDPDNAETELTFTISDLNGGVFNLIQEGVATEVTSFTLAQILAGQVQFVDNGDQIAPSFDVSVSDLEEGTVPAPVTITDFINVNDAPVANDDAGTGFSTNEDTPFTTGNVITNDVDEDGDALTILPLPEGTLTTAQGAIVTLAESGTAFNYDPNGQFEALTVGESATDTFQYTVDDGNGGTDTATVTITINGVNDAPVPTDDGGSGFATSENAAFTTGSLLTNDTDVDSDTLSIVAINGEDVTTGSVTLDSGSVVALNADPSRLDYTPAAVYDSLSAGESEIDSFTYTIADGDGGTATATVQVVINGRNDAPVAEDDSGIEFSTTEDAPLTALDVLSNDSDRDRLDVFEIISVDTSTLSGEVTLNGDGTFTYNPVGLLDFLAEGQTQEEIFSYTISDGNGGIDTATVTVVVNGVNDVPILSANAFTVNEGGTVLLTADSLRATDPDNSDSELVFTVSNVMGGSFQSSGGGSTLVQFTQQDIADGLVIFVDNGDEVAPSYRVTVTDGIAAGTAPINVNINLNPVNDPPVANDDGGTGFSTDEATPFVTGNVLANDTDVDSPTLSIAPFPNGTLVTQRGALVTIANGGGAFNYDPNGAFDLLPEGATDTDTFVYTVQDGAGGTDTATVTIGITGISNPPVANNDSATVSELSSATINVLANDQDTDSDISNLAITAINGSEFTVGTRLNLSSGSQIIVNENNTITYLPISFAGLNTGQTGADQFNYTIEDPEGNTAEATVNLTINGFSPPVATSVSGYFDYEQFLIDEASNGDATIPNDTVGILPLAQIFDENYYLTQNSDVSVLVSAGILESGYQHFVNRGLAEGRNPSILYNESFYLSSNSDVTQAVSNGTFRSGLEHFLRFGHIDLRAPTSRFRQTDYLINNPDVAAAISNGTLESGFQHYILRGADENRIPTLALYNEAFYLTNNPDIAAAVAAGDLESGFQHYISTGQREGRRPSVLFNEESYLALNPDVQNAVSAGRFESGFAHYERFGRFEGRPVF